MATQDQILKVVAGLFNGAPGGAILSDLTGAVESGLPVHELAAILADLDLFKEIVPDTATTEQKVETLLNNFGLEPGGEEGSAAALAEEYFTARIEEGANLGHIVYEAVVYLEQADLPEEFAEVAALLNNKLLVARVHAENYEDGIDSVATGQSLFEGVTSEGPSTEEEALQHIVDIIGEPGEPGEPEPPSDLAEALANLAAAQDAEAEFLKAQIDNELLEDQGLTEDSTLLQIREAITGAAAATAEALADARGGASDNVLNAELLDAQEAFDAAEADVNEVEGLSAKIAARDATKEALDAAEEALGEANAGAIGALATFNARPANAGINAAYVDPLPDVDATDVDVVVDGNDVPLIRINTGGELVIADGVDAIGINSLFTAVQTHFEAAQAEAAADEAYGEALAAIAGLEEEDADLVEALDTAKHNLETAQKAVDERNELIEARDETAALKAEADELAEAIVDARAVLTDSEEDGGFGVNLIDLDADQVGVDDEAELFLFAGVDAEIDNFGEEDLIFFGSNYTFVGLTEDQSINDRVGNASTLEIFWQVDGDNVNLYVEQDAVSGSALGTDEITTVTLVGVTDVTFEGGFVSIAAAA